MTLPPAGATAPPPDRGAQLERTRLAWGRTTLAFAVTTALAMRGFLIGSDGAGGADGVTSSAGAVLRALAVALLPLALLAFAAVARVRIRELSGPVPKRTAPPRAVLGRAALCVLALAALGGGVLLW